MTPRFLLAKYVPDLSRMEPRNIGVFVWWKGEICSRFLSTKEAGFVKDDSTYKRWLSFWSKRIAGDEVRPRRGKPVSKNDPESLDALLSTQKGNYLLVDAGELLKKIKKAELQDVTDFLFNDLVSNAKKTSAKKGNDFATQCEHILIRAGIEFKKKMPVEYKKDGISRHIHPDYYIGNGTPDAICQRADVNSERSINNAAYIIESLLGQNILAPSQCRLLIKSTEIETEVAEEGMGLLKSICPVVDVEGPSALTELSSLVSGE